MRDPSPFHTGRRIASLICGAMLAALAAQARGAEGMAPAPPALGMAVGPPDPGMAGGGPAPAQGERPRVTVPEHPLITTVRPPRRPRTFGGVETGMDGRLPNQRTGHHHEHVVRDICIGC